MSCRRLGVKLEIEIAYQLQGWSRSNRLGIAFDSSTMFQFPNGALRSPDASCDFRSI